MSDVALNPQQKKAVEHEGGPLLIIAGAGTGKTTVVTERIKWLITQKGVSPSQILALTFTEKAASEMEERVDIALPLGYSQLWISTFHAFCDRVLREEAIHIGLDPDFKLLTEAEAVLFMRKNLFRFQLDYFRPTSNPTKFLKELLNHFSRLRDEDITPEQYLEFAEKQKKQAKTAEEKEEARKTKELAKAFAKYQSLKNKEGVMDFADLISNTLWLFRKRPNVLREYQEKFRHILVDEFQDTNIAQNELVILLSGKNGNITVVGDDDQAIYKWRGAAVSNIIQFRKSFPKAKIVVLSRNYRSTGEILDKSYQLIQHNNPDRLEVKEKINKKLIPNRKIRGKPIKFILAERVEEEAEAVVREIKKLTGRRGKYQFKQIAILTRANNHADPFVRSLSRHGVPYQFLGPGQLFHQPEIKDLIAYLKVLNDPTDDVALFRVCNMDVFGISTRDLIFIRSFAQKHNLFLFEALEKIAQEKKDPRIVFPSSIEEKTKHKIKKLIRMIHRHLKLVPKESGGQILYYFLQDSKLLKKYLNPKTEKEQLAALNIAKFFDKIKSFENQSKDVLVSNLLDWITLRMEMGESPLASEIDWTEKDAVNILTVHSAKGLEFPVVFLVNLVDRRFPTLNRTEAIPVPQPLIKEILPEGDSHEQEERRLFYVGMTRAKDRLYFTAAKFYGEGKLQKRISPFVIEALGKEAVEKLIQKEQVATQQLTLLDWQSEEEKPTPPNLNPPVTYLSFSQIDSFSICPLQYKYKYILRLPTPPSASQTLGDTLHRTLKNFYQRQITSKRRLELEDLLAILEESWSSEGFSSKEHEETSKKAAKRMLINFYENGFDYSKIGNVLALEQPFSFRLTPILKIGGIMDRVDKLDEDRIEIIDYKTGARTPSQKDVDRNDQLTIYALAASTIKDLPFYRPVEKIVLSLYYLDKGVKISSTRTSKEIERIKEKIIQLVEEIEKTDFPPKPNRPFPCDHCEFKLLCDAWR